MLATNYHQSTRMIHFDLVQAVLISEICVKKNYSRSCFWDRIYMIPKIYLGVLGVLCG